MLASSWLDENASLRGKSAASNYRLQTEKMEVEWRLVTDWDENAGPRRRAFSSLDKFLKDLLHWGCPLLLTVNAKNAY